MAARPGRHRHLPLLPRFVPAALSVAIIAMLGAAVTTTMVQHQRPGPSRLKMTAT
jgi:hypothetical protein